MKRENLLGTFVAGSIAMTALLAIAGCGWGHHDVDHHDGGDHHDDPHHVQPGGDGDNLTPRQEYQEKGGPGAH